MLQDLVARGQYLVANACRCGVLRLPAQRPNRQKDGSSLADLQEGGPCPRSYDQNKNHLELAQFILMPQRSLSGRTLQELGLGRGTNRQ
jgi:hypothetical protein